MIDTNAIIRTYLLTDAPLAAVVSTRIYVPIIPEKATIPAISFFTRGGSSTPYIPPIPAPSVQFDCYGRTALEARQVYRLLYDALQGIQNVAVTIAPTTYRILGAREEVQGQDLLDADIVNYYRVMTFFEIKIR